MTQSPPNGIKCTAMDCSSNLTGTQPATSLVEHDGILQGTHWTDYPPPNLYTLWLGQNLFCDYAATTRAVK